MRPTSSLALVLIALACSGCFLGRPNLANIELRRKNQQLSDAVAQLERENAQLKSDIRRLESGRDVLPSLPQERLEQLWTVAGIKFGRATGIDRRAEGQPLKVSLRPVDAEGSTLKAAGSIVIEAFDLEAESVRLGRWEFALSDARSSWMSVGMLNEYVLTCRWESQPPPEGRKLIVKATFEDALTQRSFEGRTEVQ